MDNQLMEYVIFMVLTVLIGLVACGIICYFKPEYEKFHTDQHKYLFITILAIVGFVLRYFLTTKMGEQYLFSEPMHKLNREINNIKNTASNKISSFLEKKNKNKNQENN
jgi:hypothetical protein